MTRKLARIVSMIIFISILLQTTALGAIKEEGLPFEINAKSALLMDGGTGKVLYEKNPDEKLPVASIIKIMTLLIVFEAIDNGHVKLKDKVIISERASGMGGSQVFLDQGAEHSVEELLKSIIVASGNDASVAMAEKIAGTEEIFVQKMNEKAASLGMKNTNFVNCTGLPAENQYSTARDVAIMSKELLKHPEFFKWSTIWIDYIYHGNDRKTILTNTNRLIRFYDGADGIKTGSTNEAKYCLSATAKRGGMRLISVILAAPTTQVRFSEAQKLMDYGFANFQSLRLVKDNERIKKDIRVTGGRRNRLNAVAEKELNILVSKGDSKGIEKEYHLPDVLKAPVKKGEELGEIIFKKDGKEVGRVAVVADREIGAAGFMDNVSKILANWIRK